MTRLRRALLGWACACAIAGAAAVAAPTADPRRSGFDDMAPATQAMQRDDAQNPALLWAQDGAALWAEAPAAGRPSCAACHGPVQGMRGVATRYPRFDAATRSPISLRERIRRCRVEQQRAPAWAAESQPLLAVEAQLALQSRGLPLQPDADPRLAPWRARGERLFRQRLGQLEFSCALCHERHAGQRLGGSTIPQGHATGYPLYRLEWQGLGSLARRLRNCLAGMRAEPFDSDAPEWAALEVFLAERAAGMRFEGPAVRP